MEQNFLMESVNNAAPLNIQPVDLRQKKAGLVIIDALKGFMETGAGPLVPPVKDEVIEDVKKEIKRIAENAFNSRAPILVIRDSHQGSEYPWPDHCQQGTEEAMLINELSFLELKAEREESLITMLYKNCTSAIVDSFLTVADWINGNQLEVVVSCGVCTDICVLDFNCGLHSVRQIKNAPSLQKDGIVVYEPGCTTYDLPLENVRNLKLPDTAAHPRALMHYMAIKMMADRGIVLANEIYFR